METLEAAFEADRALVYGIGGGGDVVGAIPTARFLEDHGVDVLLGGIPWERPVRDPTPGPCPLDEIDGLQRVNGTVGLATAATRGRDGLVFAESRVAGHRDAEVALIDVGDGPSSVAAGIEDAARTLGYDLVVGVDAGGDALARGGEPGIRSPLADAIGLAALCELSTPSMLGVYGWGSDGELAAGELDAALSAVASRDGLLGAWGLTPRVARELDEVLAAVETEASRLPVEAARGRLGERTIRDGARTLRLTAASTVTFYVSPAAAAAGSEPVSLVRGAESLAAADRALREAGYTTELAVERDRTDG